MSSGTYRFEMAVSGRALCQETVHKRDGVKIQKGEFRMGSLVMFNESVSWRWKHWGCVTPRQIANIVEQLGGLDGLDLDEDLDVIDGYDIITPESQQKLKQALIDGHVADEDWNGDIELNRPGMNGVHRRTPKKKAVEEGDEIGNGDAADDTPAKSKAKNPKAKKTRGDDLDEDDGTPAPATKKKAASKKRKAGNDDLVEDESAAEEKPKRKPRAKKVKAEEDNADAPMSPPATQKIMAEERDDAVVDTKPAPKKRAFKAKQVKHEEDDDDEIPTTKPANRKIKAEEDDDDEVITKPAPKKRAPRTTKAKAESEDDEAPITTARPKKTKSEVASSNDAAIPKTALKQRASRTKKINEETPKDLPDLANSSDDDEGLALRPAPKKRASKSKKVKAEDEEEDELALPQNDGAGEVDSAEEGADEDKPVVKAKAGRKKGTAVAKGKTKKGKAK